MTVTQEYQNYFADCYVLTDKRTKEFIYSFLNEFLPGREEGADEYEIPQYSDRPNIIYKTADNLIDHLVKNKSDTHTIYWRSNHQTAVHHAMCFFTNDGQLIVGLSCETKHPDKSIEDKYFRALQSFCNCNIGYITYDEPSFHNVTEFLERVEKYKMNA